MYQRKPFSAVCANASRIAPTVTGLAEEGQHQLRVLALPELIIEKHPEQVGQDDSRHAPDKSAEKAQLRPILELQRLAPAAGRMPDRETCAEDVGGKNKNIDVGEEGNDRGRDRAGIK